MIKEFYNAIARYEDGCALYYRRRSEECENTEIAKKFLAISSQELAHANEWWELSGKKYKRSFKQMLEHPQHGKLEIFGLPSDGISKRYLWARFFFNNKHAKDFALKDILAFAIVGETFEGLAYKVLSLLTIGDVRAISTKIANEEVRHRKELYSLFCSVYNDLPYLCGWYLKAFVAGTILVFEAAIYEAYCFVMIVLGAVIGIIGLLFVLITNAGEDGID